MSTWWSEWREVYFQLMTLSTSAPWDPPAGHRHRVYSDGTLSFHESELAGNFDEVEEQLWAIRRDLASKPEYHYRNKNIDKPIIQKGKYMRKRIAPRTQSAPISQKKGKNLKRKKRGDRHELRRCAFTELNAINRLVHPMSNFTHVDEMCVQLYFDVLGHGFNGETARA